MIISNSSPLIVLGRLNRLDIFRELFEEVHIPGAVYRETVEETRLVHQREAILDAIASRYLLVDESLSNHSFRRTLDAGERDVLSLAVERQAQLLILDDRKARNEAGELGFQLAYTTDILRAAAARQLIPSYAEALERLHEMHIFLPG